MAEVQDIFRQFGQSYQEQHKLPVHVLKARIAIERCRTADLGSHTDVCENCGNVLRISYNSCRNRHFTPTKLKLRRGPRLSKMSSTLQRTVD